jgi:hypothetical protein
MTEITFLIDNDGKCTPTSYKIQVIDVAKSDIGKPAKSIPLNAAAFNLKILDSFGGLSRSFHNKSHVSTTDLNNFPNNNTPTIEELSNLESQQIYTSNADIEMSVKESDEGIYNVSTVYEQADDIKKSSAHDFTDGSESTLEEITTNSTSQPWKLLGSLSVCGLTSSELSNEQISVLSRAIANSLNIASPNHDVKAEDVSILSWHSLLESSDADTEEINHQVYFQVLVHPESFGYTSKDSINQATEDMHKYLKLSMQSGGFLVELAYLASTESADGFCGVSINELTHHLIEGLDFTWDTNDENKRITLIVILGSLPVIGVLIGAIIYHFTKVPEKVPITADELLFNVNKNIEEAYADINRYKYYSNIDIDSIMWYYREKSADKDIWKPVWSIPSIITDAKPKFTRPALPPIETKSRVSDISMTNTNLHDEMLDESSRYTSNKYEIDFNTTL